MKKTLIAVAALSAMAASAMAANVTLYGKIDQGFQVQSKKVDGKDRVTTWKGVSGISSGSRWGLRERNNSPTVTQLVSFLNPDSME